MVKPSEVINSFGLIHNEITQFFAKQQSLFSCEDCWDYKKGKGGGVTRTWNESGFIEKAGVNFSHIEGDRLPQLALDKAKKVSTSFLATGVSLVIHPKNPFVPTIHMNIRYF